MRSLRISITLLVLIGSLVAIYASCRAKKSKSVLLATELTKYEPITLTYDADILISYEVTIHRWAIDIDPHGCWPWYGTFWWKRGFVWISERLPACRYFTNAYDCVRYIEQKGKAVNGGTVDICYYWCGSAVQSEPFHQFCVTNNMNLIEIYVSDPQTFVTNGCLTVKANTNSCSLSRNSLVL